MAIKEIIVVGIGRTDALELQRRHSGPSKIKEHAPLGPGQQGTPGAVDLVLTFGPPLISLLAIWLLRTRHGVTFKHTITARDEYGNERHETIVFNEFSSKAPAEAVTKAISSLCEIPLDEAAIRVKQAIMAVNKDGQ